MSRRRAHEDDDGYGIITFFNLYCYLIHSNFVKSIQLVIIILMIIKICYNQTFFQYIYI